MRILNVLFIACLWLPVVSLAQEATFSPIKDVSALQQKLAQNAAKTRTIASDFIQEKHMKMLQDKTVSRGKFYFKQEDKIRIEYTSPFSYLIVMSGGNITIKDNGKVTKVNTRNSKTMQSVNEVMMDCVKGTVFDNKDFLVAAFEAVKAYKMVLTPVNKDMLSLFSKIEVVIRKSDLAVVSLVMKQSNGDDTEMKFLHTQINMPLKDALFFIH